MAPAPAPLPFRPVVRRNTYEQVAEDLARAIADGRLAAGEALPSERELTRAYGVGRSSVREAVRVLESRGLVEGNGRAGFVIGGARSLLRRTLHHLVTADQVALSDLFEVRRMLEVETAGLAAARRTPTDLAELGAHLRAMEQGLAEPERYRTADLAFHLALAAATHNRLVVRLMDGVRDAMSRAFVVAYAIPGSPARSVGQHRAILGAVAEGDPASARDRMQGHLARVERDVLGIAGDTGAARTGGDGGAVS